MGKLVGTSRRKPGYTARMGIVELRAKGWYSMAVGELTGYNRKLLKPESLVTEFGPRFSTIESTNFILSTAETMQLVF